MHLGVGYNFKGLSYWWQEEQLWQLTLSSASLLLLHFNVASSGMRWVPTFPLLALHVNVKFAVPEWKRNVKLWIWSVIKYVDSFRRDFSLFTAGWKSLFWNGYCFTHLQIFRSRLLSFAEVILIYSRVHKSSDSFFSNILEKPSIVQKKMIPHRNGLHFSMKWSKKKNSKWPT